MQNLISQQVCQLSLKCQLEMFLTELKMKSILPSIVDNDDVEKAKSKVGESLPCTVTEMEMMIMPKIQLKWHKFLWSMLK